LGGAADDIACVGLGTHHWVGEVEFVLGSCEGDVEEAAERNIELRTPKIEL
jgi:hypothetical protein